MPYYQVKTAIKHNKKLYSEGSLIELSEKVALELGSLVELAGVEIETSIGAQINSSLADLKVDTLVNAGIDELKEIATRNEIPYNPNIGPDKLRERIKTVLVENAEVIDNPEDTEGENING